jgi:signal peptidase II
MKPRLFPLWLALAALVAALDQLAKWFIASHWQLGEAMRITGFFNIVRAHNSGAAFSFLQNAGGWQRWLFTVLALAVSIFIIWLLRKHAGQKLFAFGLCLILGGAVGNLIDRSLYGYVVDYLDFHWRFLDLLFYGGHFPAFNLADSAITCGVALIIVDELRRSRRA